MNVRIKYPRTLHLPWSESISSDDKVLESVEVFLGKRVVVTEKMDGENTTLYSDYIHARSLDSRHHISRDWVKGLWSSIKHNIPEGWRVCGENLYARHSISYNFLESYFLVFSIWDGMLCLGWEDTISYSLMLGLRTVPILYIGEFSESVIKGLWRGRNSNSEGYVVRLHESFNYSEFSNCVGKFVRQNHIQTGDSWSSSEVVKNSLRSL